MIKAVIFDMDGVVLDSEKYWPISDAKLFAEILPGFDRSEMPSTMGMGNFMIYQILKERFQFDLESDEFNLLRIEAAKQNVYTAAQYMPGFLDFITRVREDDKRTALGTSTPFDIVKEIMVTHSEMNELFDAVATPNDTGGRSKPFPDIFLKAAEKIQTEPEYCLVIEDADHGISAAKAAGMKVLGFRNGMNSKQSLSDADYIFNDFSELDKNFLSRFSGLT